MYAYAFLGDLVLLYPVYALLFADAGLSTAEISSLFAIWSIAGFVLELPSGVWADAVSRRRLLVLAPLLSGAGWGLWVAAPSYAAFAVGFVLWGAQGALQSGALEALVYEELDRLGEAPRYPTVMGRATAAGTVAACASMGLAAPVFALGGFAALGAASVLTALAAALVARGFPEPRSPAADEGDDEDDDRGYAALLRAGVREALASPALRAALGIAAVVEVVWGSLDEYLPLLAAEGGASAAAVPLLGLLVYGGMVAGGAAAGRAAALSARGFAGLLVVAAVLLAGGALTGIAGFVLIAVAFGLFQAATVVADARLQDAIEGPSRATITSFAGLATEVLVVAVFGLYALGSTALSHAALFAVLAATYVAVAVYAATRGRAGG